MAATFGIQVINGQIVENQDIVQFCRPAYRIVNGKPVLMRDEIGNYVFCDVEWEKPGKIVKSPDGFPIFQPAFGK